MSRLPEVWRPGELPDYAGPALLDTHIWIWYLDGETARMSEETIELLRRCTGGSGLLVSDISVWEIGNKAAKGKLTLMPSVDFWLDRASGRPGFSFFPLSREILLASTQLPGAVQGDPADRILIASAALRGVPLVTADALIVDYARKIGGFSVADARR